MIQEHADAVRRSPTPGYEREETAEAQAVRLM